jgi:iron complex outermembrane recepter protein
MNRGFARTLLGGIATALCAVQAAAQSETTQNTGVETVVVTAEKRAENVQDVPISMVALQAEQLDKYDTSSLEQLQSTVPNLFINQSPLNDAIYMRGFGSSATNFAFDQSVSLYQDGIYGGRARQFMAPFFDVDRIEVLRGPQGALLGKNTAAGAISIITANPTDDFEGAVTTDYNFDRSGVDTYGFVSGPLTDDLGARLAVKFTSLGGYEPNTFDNKSVPTDQDELGRLTLRYAPTPNFDVTTKFEFGDSVVDGMNIVPLSLTSLVPLPSSQDEATKFGIPPRDRQTDINSATTANFRFDGYTLTSITGYSYFRDNKAFYGGANTNPLEYVEDVEEGFSQFSQELQLFSPSDQPLEWILGAYYDSSHDSIFTVQEYDVFGGFLDGEDSEPFGQDARTLSTFVQATYHFTDNFRFLGSLRYTNIQKTADFQELADFGGQLAPPGSLVNGHINESNVDPSATFQYDLRQGFMLYATYARGSKAGGFVSNVGTTTDSTFAYKPEVSTNFEVGAKTSFLDGRLIADLSLYDTRFRDLQVSVYQPNIPGFVTGNAASATSKGFEGSLSWLPVDDLTLTWSGAYTDASYDNFPGAACLAANANPQPPCSAAGTTNLAGYTLFYSSKWSGNVQADYSHPINDYLQFAGNLTMFFRSRFADSTDEDPFYGFQDGYMKLDARIQVGPPDDKWVVALIGKNLTDIRTAANAYSWPLSSPPQALAFLDPPREISIEVKYKF